MKQLIALIFIPLTLFSTEFAPWFGRSLEIESRATAHLYSFHSIATPIRPTKYDSFAQFYTGSLSSAFDWVAGELELTLANTPSRSFGFDNLKVTGRAQLFNDVVDDFLSVVAGVTLSAASNRAVNDISSFHHAALEVEGTLSFGKECSVRQFWVQRWWGLLGFGLGNKGVPWVRGDLTWERNFWDIHTFQVFTHTLWGLGNRDIRLNKKFTGYGLIKHRSVDLGFRYTRLVGCWGGAASFEYGRRLYALNFPKNCNLFLLRLYYPFGL